MAPDLARRRCTQRFSRAGNRLVKQRDAECHPYHAPTNLDENYFRFSASEPEFVISTIRSDFAGSLSRYSLHAAGVSKGGRLQV